VTRRKGLLAVAGGALLALLTTGTRGLSAGEPGGPDLRLRAARFDPLRQAPAGAIERFPESLRSHGSPDGLALIQFEGPPRSEWLRDLHDAGAVLFDYVPRHAYLARIAPGGTMAIRALPFVRTVVSYVPAFRVAPDLVARAAEPRGEPLRLLVEATPDLPRGAMVAALAREAPRAALTDEGHTPRARLAEIEVGDHDLSSLLARLASIPDVVWIEERRPALPNNDSMKWVMQTGVSGDTRLFSRGLTGTGQIIAEGDSGLDTAHCFFTDSAQSVTFELVDPDNPPAVPVTNPAHRKVLAYQYHSASNTVDQIGHGTHVAGTAAGDDLAHLASGSNPGLDTYDGMAPSARLVLQDIDKSGGFLEIPASYYGFVQAAYNAGARIHTNSWGSDTNTYTGDAAQIDDFMWDHPDMLFTISAGNAGPNAGTVGTPGVAKNALTVGMVETPASGSPNNVSSQSSNGPTSDGRLKPDVVNVGGFPIHSAAAGTACGIADSGGTSMATPGVAGGAALLRQFFAQGYYPHGYPGSGPAIAPSAALLKATIVNSAVNISGTNVDGPIPDGSQGWGRVTLDNAVPFPSDDRRLLILHDDDLSSPTDGFAAGASVPQIYSVFTCRQDVPLKVTLVWTDAPTAAGSAEAWVNDLNLEVVAPDATLYRGNFFSGGVSAAGGVTDPRNTVEQVLIPAGAVQSGTYTVRVVPADVAVGPQPYALVVTGDVSAAPVPRLVVTAINRAGGCDGDAFLDQGESLTLTYTVANQGCGDAGALGTSLAPDTLLPVGTAPSGPPPAGIPAGTSAPVSFLVSLGDTGGGCGGSVPLTLALQAANGARWEIRDLQPVRLDPASGVITLLDNVETGDHSVAKDAAWLIGTCAAVSPTHSWHLGQADCTGIPQDALAHSLEFSVTVPSGQDLASARFTHRFDGYMNASFADSVHLEIDHDLDGSFQTIASWTDANAPKSLTLAGPFDLSAFNAGRAASVRFRFRFQSAAQWVGGPNNAPGWDVDDFRVDLLQFGTCDVNSQAPPGNVGNTLEASKSGNDVLLGWTAPAGAASYKVLRSASPNFSGPEIFTSTAPSFLDPGALLDPRSFYYSVTAVSACGVASQD
jgi:hypothetical protein